MGCAPPSSYGQNKVFYHFSASTKRVRKSLVRYPDLEFDVDEAGKIIRKAWDDFF